MQLALQRVVLLVLLTFAASAARAATKPEPPLLIPLAPLGVPAPQPQMLAAGATLYTINFVDNTHLLLTYFTRGLLPRLPDDDANDSDGIVAGVLLELPSGKPIARTEWRVHDRNTYLWPLGHGRFLFRIRSSLTILDPLGSGFTPELFGNLSRRIGYITTSPGADLLSIETLPPLKRAAAGQASVAFDEEQPNRAVVQIAFYRLAVEEGHLHHTAAGALAAGNLISIPANASGYLRAEKESPAVYNFDFISHDGKKKELAAFDTSCPPRAHWISRTEFIAFGCQVGGSKPTLAVFNLKGENPWINVLNGQQLAPSILPSPESGRFALNRVTVSPTAENLENLLPSEITGQEITVFQSYDGRQLQKLNASPVQRAGQNYDLSPSGEALALTQNGAIAIYKLPSLTAKDKAALAQMQAMEPSANSARIQLDSVPINAPAQASEPLPEALPGAATVATTPPAAPAAERTNIVGDVPVERRKPPTLYDPEHPPQSGDAKPKN